MVLLNFIFILYCDIPYKNTTLLIYFNTTMNISNRHQKYILNIYWPSGKITFSNYAFGKYNIKITKSRGQFCLLFFLCYSNVWIIGDTMYIIYLRDSIYIKISSFKSCQENHYHHNSELDKIHQDYLLCPEKYA